MKKSTIIAAFFSLAFISPALASCGSDGNNDPSAGAVNVTVAPEFLQADARKQNLELSVTVGADWAITANADWVSIRPSGGVKDATGIVKVSVDANSGLEERSALINILCGGKAIKTVTLTQGFVSQASSSVSSLTFGGQESTSTFTVTSNCDWELSTSDSWISVSPANGSKGETEVRVSVSENNSEIGREGILNLSFAGDKSEIKVSQLSDVVNVPEGYTLVWSDEFNEGSVPGSDWVHENWAAGYVNNELQTYTDKAVDGKRTTEIKDGFLNINCFKGSDGKIYSGRINAKPSTGWLYGYFEARICLPTGKGTWPAFWMMPCNVDWGSNPWPKCGEIDIMEEVGADPDEVSSSLHTENYNHTKNTQKTHAMHCAGAEGEFHTYAVEWTEDAITTYVDGKVQLRCLKSEMGADHDSWPFHYAFHPILNLAWGGDWGGYKGVDESALPVTMKVDYVRIFQKK
ncbi:MAG: family 16 glycosylhydrolase [Muribaculaceae bacterium]|nr:family 16 glycosylhydrolase [Muribaculaceae bacterium]